MLQELLQKSGHTEATLLALKGMTEEKYQFLLQTETPDSHPLEKLLELIQQAGYQFYQLGTHKILSMDPEYLNKLIPTGSSLNVMATAL